MGGYYENGFSKVNWEVLNRNDLARDKDEFRALIKSGDKLLGPIKCGKVLE
jgi:hypothetical protein